MPNGTVYDLQPGCSYRVVRDFSDFYDGAFTAGTTLTFRGHNFVPYHGGYTVEFEEQTVYLQAEQNSDILNDIWSYLEPMPPST